MKTEILVALVAIGGTLVGAFIGAYVSVWITKQHLSLSFKQHNLEILQEQTTRLQNALDQISGASTDLKDQNLTPDQIHARMTDSFLRRLQLFLNISHFFPKQFEEEVIELSTQINKFIYLAKTGKPINEVVARNAVEQFPVTEKKIFTLIRERLRLLQSEIDKMTIDLKL